MLDCYQLGLKPVYAGAPPGLQLPLCHVLHSVYRPNHRGAMMAQEQLLHPACLQHSRCCSGSVDWQAAQQCYSQVTRQKSSGRRIGQTNRPLLTVGN